MEQTSNKTEETDTSKDENTVVGSVVDTAATIQIQYDELDLNNIELYIRVPDGIQIESVSYEIQAIVRNSEFVEFIPSDGFPIQLKNRSVNNSLDLALSSLEDIESFLENGNLKLGVIKSDETILTENLRILNASEIYINSELYTIDE